MKWNNKATALTVFGMAATLTLAGCSGGSASGGASGGGDGGYKIAFVQGVADDYEKIRVQHAGKRGPQLITLAAARANAHRADWAAYAPPVPSFLGPRPFRNADLADIARFIDWGPFFAAAFLQHRRASTRGRNFWSNCQ